MFLMAIYHLGVFCEGIQVSISAVRRDKNFYNAVSKVIHETLIGALFTMKVYDGGVIIDGSNISDKFLGTTIPFVYGKRSVELRVYPETLS